MAFNYFSLLSHLMVASAAASFGFLLGTLLQSGKVSKLYRRLDVANALIRDQAARNLEFANASLTRAVDTDDHDTGRTGTSAFPQFSTAATANLKTPRKRGVGASAMSESHESG